MGLELTRWDIQDYLTSPERMVGYLEAAFEEGDPEFMATAIQDVARAKGIQIAPDSAQYDLTCLMKVMEALGLELARKAA